MSKSQNPMTGHMCGSMANFNTYVRYGENIISSKAFNRRDANTVSQIAQRASFKLITKAYHSFGGVPKTSFPCRVESLSPLAAFIAANLPEAIDKTGAVPVIDYSKMLVSSGNLPLVEVPTAVAGAAGITLSYKSDHIIPDVSATDEVTALAKLKTGGLLMARQVRGAQEMGSILLTYAGISADDVECCFLFVMNEDGSNASDSTYVVVS
ncbi:MAG: DUF6266 family protein [Paludibacter sp.]|nr:DUF6266 family protein [Paludibacter sp.]